MIGSMTQRNMNSGVFPRGLGQLFGPCIVRVVGADGVSHPQARSLFQCLDRIRDGNMAGIVLLLVAGLMGWVAALLGKIDEIRDVAFTIGFTLVLMALSAFASYRAERSFVKKFEERYDELVLLLQRFNQDEMPWFQRSPLMLQGLGEEILVQEAMKVVRAQANALPEHAIDELRAKCSQTHKLLMYYNLVGNDYTPHYRKAEERVKQEREKVTT